MTPPDIERFNALHEYWAMAHGLRGDPRLRGEYFSKDILALSAMRAKAVRLLADFWDEQDAKDKQQTNQ